MTGSMSEKNYVYDVGPIGIRPIVETIEAEPREATQWTSICKLSMVFSSSFITSDQVIAFFNMSLNDLCSMGIDIGKALGTTPACS